MSNYTLLRADRATHLKIISVSLIAGLLVIGVGVSARQPGGRSLSSEDNGGVLRTGKAISLSSRETATVR